MSQPIKVEWVPLHYVVTPTLFLGWSWAVTIKHRIFKIESKVSWECLCHRTHQFHPNPETLLQNDVRLDYLMLPPFYFVQHRGFLTTDLSKIARVLYFWNRQKGLNFQFKMLNIQYSLDNVSNMYWTKCLYPMSKQSKVRQNIFRLFIICPITCSTKSHFVQPHVVLRKEEDKTNRIRLAD